MNPNADYSIKPPFWRETWFYEQVFYVLVCLTPAMLASLQTSCSLWAPRLASSWHRKREAWPAKKTRRGRQHDPARASLETPSRNG